MFRAPGCIVVRDASTPVPAAGEARVKIAFRGVCGSDLHRFRGQVPLISVTPGHEISGVVDEVGLGVAGLAPGDRVCVERLVPCGQCRYCSTGHHQLCADARFLAADVDGGFADYVCVPPRMLHRLPAVGNSVVCEFDIVGSRGRIRIGNTHFPELYTLDPDCTMALAKRAFPGSVVAKSPMTVAAEELIRALETGEPPASDLHDARSDLELSVAFHLADRTGGGISLPITELDYSIADPWGRYA